MTEDTLEQTTGQNKIISQEPYESNKVVIGFESSLGKTGIVSEQNLHLPARSEGEIDRRLAFVSGTTMHYIFHAMILRRLAPEFQVGTNTPVSDEASFDHMQVFPSEESIVDMEFMGKTVPNINIDHSDPARAKHLEIYLKTQWGRITKFHESFIRGISKHPYLSARNVVIITEVRLPALTENLKVLTNALRENNISYRMDINPREARFGRETTVNKNLIHLLRQSSYDRVLTEEQEFRNNPKTGTDSGFDDEKLPEKQVTVGDNLTNQQNNQLTQVSEYVSNSPLIENAKINTTDNQVQQLDITEKDKLDDLLFRIVVNKESVGKYFPEVENMLGKQDLHNLLYKMDKKEFDLIITDLLNQGKIPYQDFGTLVALRVISQAVNEMNFFIGGSVGKNKVGDREEFTHILSDIGFDLKNGDKNQLDRLHSSLPTVEKNYREPSGIRPDAMVFEMPAEMNEDQVIFINKFRKYLSVQYIKGSSPALLTDMNFYRMVDEGVKLGMKIKTLELKTSLDTMDDQTKYDKELFYYVMSMMQGLVAYRHFDMVFPPKDTEKDYKYRYMQILHDPILNAHEGAEVITANMIKQHGQIGVEITQIEDIKHRFSGGYEDIKRNFGYIRKYYKDIIKKIFVARNVMGNPVRNTN